MVLMLDARSKKMKRAYMELDSIEMQGEQRLRDHRLYDFV
jgi:hypothetical protein